MGRVFGDAELTAPSGNSLPARKLRAARGHPELHAIRVRLETVTPILGGGHEPRALDEVDIIRAASVRGHLRLWWRALYAAQAVSSQDLHTRERALWGHADNGGRSAVETRIDVENEGEVDCEDIDERRGILGAYALWPARSERKQGQVVKPPAPRSTYGRPSAARCNHGRRRSIGEGGCGRERADCHGPSGTRRGAHRARGVRAATHSSIAMDMAAGAPKPTSRMVAPGVVYFFKRGDGRAFGEVEARSLCLRRAYAHRGTVRPGGGRRVESNWLLIA